MIRPTINACPIGNEGQPLAVIDGFHPDPDALRAQAGHAAFTPGLHHYPGIRAPLPSDYMAAVEPAIAAALADAFAHRGATQLIDASFSIVTTPADRLSVPQRLPHMDATDRRRIALVHYLQPDGGDGTAFYRHRSTGFETIDHVRASIYLGQVDAELRHGGEPVPGYVAGSTPLFEQIAQVEARYNRAVLYRSVLLHSGAIAPGAVLDDDPATGRLTVTAFLSLA